MEADGAAWLGRIAEEGLAGGDGHAVLNGLAVAARKILTGEPVTASRALLSLSSALIPDYDSPREVAERRKATAEFVAKLNVTLGR